MLPAALRLHDERYGTIGSLFTIVGDKVGHMLGYGSPQGIERTGRHPAADK